MHPLCHILALAFLAPWLMAAGAAATSVPIIIHLLNKRKFRIVIWAAMDWLLAAQRRNARRLRFQRWLLLAIRCLAILVIAAGVAELVLQTPVLGALLGEQRAVVIIWDDSYSMGFQQPAGDGVAGANAFEKSKRLLTDYLEHLRPADRVLLIRASTVSLADPSSAAAKATPDHQSIISHIRGSRLSDAATDLPAAFDRARKALTDLESSTRQRQLLVLSDATNSSIRDPRRAAGMDNLIEGSDGERLKHAAQAAAAHATDFRFIDMGAENQTNLAVTALASRRPVVVAGQAADFQVEIFNASDQPALDVPVTLLVDGVPSRSLRIGKIDPASFQTTEAALTLPTIGRHLVEARLSADQLPVDDSRRLMLNVRKEIPVLLVDGSPGDGKTSYGSTFYLYAAYAIPAQGKPAGIFAPKVITELELPTTTLSNYDVVVLADAADSPPATRDALRDFVHAGGLLIIFPGNRTNTQRMNESLGDAGTKLLPATLGQPVKLDTTGQPVDGIAFAPEGYQKNPVMQIFAASEKEGRQIGFTSVTTSQYLKLGVPTDGSTETILRYANKDGTPGDAAVVLRRGLDSAGNVVLFAGTADMAWNTWGAKPSFLPFIHELTFYAMGRSTLGASAGLTLDVGRSLHLPGDVASAGPWTGPRDEHIAVTQEIKDGRPFLTSPPLVYAGTYAPTSGDSRPVIAVNPEAREADIRHVAPAQMSAALGIGAASIIQRPTLLQWADAGSQRPISWLGPFLVALALALFAFESTIALLFSRYR